MNNARRKALRDALTRLEEVKGMIEICRDEEQEAFDNMPESLQSGEKGQAAEDAISALEDAVNGFEEIVSQIEDAIGG